MDERIKVSIAWISNKETRRAKRGGNRAERAMSTYVKLEPFIPLGPGSLEFHLQHLFAVPLAKLLLKVGLDAVPHVLASFGAVPPSRLEDAPLFFGTPVFEGRRDLLAEAVFVLVAGIDVLLAAERGALSLGRPRLLHPRAALGGRASTGRAAGRPASGVATADVATVVCAGPSHAVIV